MIFKEFFGIIYIENKKGIEIMENLKHLYSQKFSNLPEEPEALRKKVEDLVDYAIKNYYDIYYEGDLELYLI